MRPNAPWDDDHEEQLWWLLTQVRCGRRERNKNNKQSFHKINQEVKKKCNKKSRRNVRKVWTLTDCPHTAKGSCSAGSVVVFLCFLSSCPTGGPHWAGISGVSSHCSQEATHLGLHTLEQHVILQQQFTPQRLFLQENQHLCACFYYLSASQHVFVYKLPLFFIQHKLFLITLNLYFITLTFLGKKKLD